MASQSFQSQPRSNGATTGTSSSVNSSANAAAAAIDEDEGFDPKYPLWKYVKNIEKTGGNTGGNARSECKFCGHIIPGSYSRVKAHLLKITGKGTKICHKVTVPILEQLRKDVAAGEEEVARNTPRSVPLPVAVCPTSLGVSRLPPSLAKSKRSKQGDIEESFHMQARQMADALIARMFYTAGLPFNLARNPYFRASFNLLANSDLGGYVPPSYNRLRTTLLQEERANVARLLDPLKSTWGLKGVTITADGWTDAQRRPLINFLAVTDSGPMFLKACNTEGEIKTKEYIAEKLAAVIEEVGSKNVVQVITDNAANCKAAGLIIEQRYKNIFWTPCVVHTLNLALKNICAARNNNGENQQLAWISEVAADANQIKNFIMNHGMRLSMFNEFSKLKFIAIADTRFASVVVMLKRFLLLKDSLMLMVINDKWDAYKEDDEEKAQFVRGKILSDVWWNKIKYIVDFTDPIYSMLRAADTDQPCLHLIYEMWDSMIEKVKVKIYRHEGKAMDEESEFFDIVNEILQARWLKSSTPLHCLAHSLNPRYYTGQWLSEVLGRVAPHEDAEISEERNKCFRKFFPVIEDLRKIKQQFADFSLCGPNFDSFDSIEDRAHFHPKQWWGTYGQRAPELKALAFKLLGQPASSSCCERNWSIYGFIHSLRRNNLTVERAEDLVFIHTNMRLLSRNSPDYKSGPSQMWDIGGDNFESFDGVGILEVADLSLDEPAFEQMACELEGGVLTDG